MSDRSMRFGAVLLVATALLVAGCGDDGDEADDSATDVVPGDESTTSTTLDADLPTGDEPRTDVDLVCAAGPFSPDALESEDGLPDGIETEEGPAADTLRQLLGDTEAQGQVDVPDRSWRELSTLTTDDGTIYEFAHGSPPDLWVATVQQLGDGDRWQGEFVAPCTPRPWVDGLLVGYWWPADDGAVDADTTEVDVLVQEDSCDSGRGPDGRVREPEITYGADVVVVTYPVTAREEGGAFTCQSHPPAEVTLELDQPLGDRELLDGSTWPAHEPSSNGPAQVGDPAGEPDA
jgi:hypothetical protein